MSKITIFHIDDHHLFSQGLSSLLADEGSFDLLGYAGDPDEGKEKVKQLQPNIVLVDYFLPGKNGIELGKEILKGSPQSKLILLTMEKSFPVFEAAKKAGFFGFLSKSSERKVVVKAILDVSQGLKVFLQIEYSDENEEPVMAKFRLLSKREKEIALLVVQGYSSNEIAEKLFLSLWTVNTHRRNLFKKLAFKNVAQLSALFHNMGET